MPRMAAHARCAHVHNFALPAACALAALSLAVSVAAGTDQSTQVDWLARVQREIATKEYEASRNAVGLQAPNRAHNLRTYFEPTGVRVVDRTAKGGPALLELRLAGLGRSEELQPVAPGEVQHEGARVEIRRPGLVEWYENAPAGLEQGFTLAARPSGRGPLVLELAVAGAQAARRGDAIEFRTRAGRRLRYAGLAVADAGGNDVAAQLASPAPDRLRFVVDDANAVYPLTIDPILSTPAATRIHSAQFAGELGKSVAGAGDVNGDGYDDVIVGAPFYDSGHPNEGAAFVFLGNTPGVVDGTPSTAAAMIQSNQVDARLGYGVAGAGDVNGDGYDETIVGAPGFRIGANWPGAAFIQAPEPSFGIGLAAGALLLALLARYRRRSPAARRRRRGV